MQWTDPLGVGLIQHLTPVTSHPHQSNVAEDAQVLRNCWLAHREGVHDLAHRPPAIAKQVEDPSSLRLGQHEEGICGHATHIA